MTNMDSWQFYWNKTGVFRLWLLKSGWLCGWCWLSLFFFFALQSIWHYSPLSELANLSDDVQCFPGTVEFSSVTQICCCTLVCLSWLWELLHGGRPQECKNHSIWVSGSQSVVHGPAKFTHANSQAPSQTCWLGTYLLARSPGDLYAR